MKLHIERMFDNVFRDFFHLRESIQPYPANRRQLVNSQLNKTKLNFSPTKS